MLPVRDFRTRKSFTPTARFNRSFTKAETQVPDFIGKIRIKVLLAFGIFILGLFTTQLVFASNLSTDGQKLSEIEKEIRNIESQNASLKVKIAQESSLTSLAQKAQSLNFKKPEKIITP